MKHDLTIVAGMTGLLALAGCATSPRVAPAMGPPTSGIDGTCLKDTGSRIASEGSGCAAVGRSYSSEDISRTGAATAAGALPLIDPSITVRH